MFLSHLYRGYYFDEYYIVYSDINLQLLTIKKGNRSEKPSNRQENSGEDTTMEQINFFFAVIILICFSSLQICIDVM
jgi:hypothetical protein